MFGIPSTWSLKTTKGPTRRVRKLLKKIKHVSYASLTFFFRVSLKRKRKEEDFTLKKKGKLRILLYSNLLGLFLRDTKRSLLIGPFAVWYPFYLVLKNKRRRDTKLRIRVVGPFFVCEASPFFLRVKSSCWPKFYFVKQGIQEGIRALVSAQPFL